MEVVDGFEIGEFAKEGGDGLAAFPEGDVVAVALLVGLHGYEGVVG